MTEPLEIAVLGSFPPLRAISAYCLEFARALAEHALVRFISFKRLYPSFLYPGGGLRDDESFPEIAQALLSVQRRLTWYNPFGWIREGLLTRGQLLHAQWWSVPLLPVYLVVCGLFRLRGRPVVITVHNVLGHEGRNLSARAAGLLFRVADHFIVHAAQNRAQLQQIYGIPEQAISVIPHGTLDFFAHGKIDSSQARRDLGLADTHRVILLFGAIRPYKGVDTALRALARIAPEHPDVRLVVAGHAWSDWGEYEALIDRLQLGAQVIRHIGYIATEDVGRYFMAADLVLLPYRHFDSQSGVGSAALAFRKPLIVSDVGGLPDLVEDRNYVVLPGDEVALARAILRCLTTEGELERMGQAAVRAAEKFGWSTIARETLTVYQQVLERAGRS